MSERDLEKYLLQQVDSKNKQDQSIEQIRKEIVKQAQEAVDLYERQCKEAEPEARKAIDKTVRPWWNDFLNSKTFSLLEHAHWSSSEIYLSEWYSHNWPQRLFKEINENSRPFAWKAGYDVREQLKQPKEIRVQEAAPKKRSFLENYETAFYVPRGQDRRLFVNRWPVGGGGMYFSGHHQLVDFDDFGAGLDSTHPIVFTKFAETIESGRVWKVIDKSIKGRR